MQRFLVTMATGAIVIAIICAVIWLVTENPEPSTMALRIIGAIMAIGIACWAFGTVALTIIGQIMDS